MFLEHMKKYIFLYILLWLFFYLLLIFIIPYPVYFSWWIITLYYWVLFVVWVFIRLLKKKTMFLIWFGVTSIVPIILSILIYIVVDNFGGNGVYLYFLLFMGYLIGILIVLSWIKYETWGKFICWLISIFVLFMLIFHFGPYSFFMPF